MRATIHPAETRRTRRVVQRSLKFAGSTRVATSTATKPRARILDKVRGRLASAVVKRVIRRSQRGM